MIKIKGKGLRILKSCHLLGVVCWMGGSVTSLMLLTKLSTVSSQQSLYDVLRLLEMIDLSMIASAAMFTVGVGLVYGIFTSWGFIRVRWVLIKWMLSLGIIVSGTVLYIPALEQMGAVVTLQGMKAISTAAFQSVLTQVYILFGCHLAAMVFMVFLSVLRPWSKAKKK